MVALYEFTYQACPGVMKILGSTLQCVCHSQCCSCSAVTSWEELSMSTFYSSNVTAAMRQDIATPVPSPHTATCSLSEKSICSLAAASQLARVIPQTTSLQRTSGCTLYKLNLGLHLHRDNLGLTLEVQMRFSHGYVLFVNIVFHLLSAPCWWVQVFEPFCRWFLFPVMTHSHPTFKKAWEYNKHYNYSDAIRGNKL